MKINIKAISLYWSIAASFGSLIALFITIVRAAFWGDWSITIHFNKYHEGIIEFIVLGTGMITSGYWYVKYLNKKMVGCDYGGSCIFKRRDLEGIIQR